MHTTIRTFALEGISARALRVEVDVLPGLPSFTIVGLPDRAVREARERVRAALVNSGFEFPLRRIVVNLAPASLRRVSPAMDLPIAAALLAASGQIELRRLAYVAFVGELALDGSVRPAQGVLPFVEAAKRFGAATILVPADNGAEAALVEGIDIATIEHLAGLPALCSGELDPTPPKALQIGLDPPADSPDLADLRGQPELRAALELAAAGGHSMLMVGPRGSGRTMAAIRLPSILPPLQRAEAMEVARIASATGRLNRAGWRGGRPFRAPHHAISPAGLVGGGIPARAGEATLAHRGVLFLDQLDEFSRDAIEALRATMGAGAVRPHPGCSRRSFPPRFLLAAAANPCPCGRGPGDVECTCAPPEIARHQARVTAALGAAIEILVHLRQPSAAEIGGPPGESSAVVADRAFRARELQERRLGPGRCNAQMTPAETRSCPLHPDAVMAIADIYARGRLSGWDHDGVLRLAQTLADLDEASVIEERHLVEALRLRGSTLRPSRPYTQLGV